MPITKNDSCQYNPSSGVSFSRVKASIKNTLIGSIPILLMVWLLMGYLLPNTYFEILSARKIAVIGLLAIYPRFMLLAVGAALLLALASYYTRCLQGDKWKILVWWLVVVYTSAYAVVPLVSGYSGLHIVRCGFLLLAIVVGLIVARVVVSIREFCIVVCLLACIQACYSIVLFCNGHSIWISHHVQRAGGTFDSPAEVYGVLILCLPLSITLMCSSERSTQKSIWACVNLLIITALLAAFSRGGLLAATASLLWLSIHLRTNRQLARSFFIFVCILLLFGLIVRGDGVWQRTALDGMYRWQLWQHAWSLFLSAPLAGVGIDQIQLSVRETHADGRLFTQFATPDNLLLHWLCERGLAGGLLLFGLVVGTSKLLTRRRPMQQDFQLALQASLIAALVAGIMDTPFGRLERAPETVLIVAILGLVLRLDNLPTSRWFVAFPILQR